MSFVMSHTSASNVQYSIEMLYQSCDLPTHSPPPPHSCSRSALLHNIVFMFLVTSKNIIMSNS